MPPPRASLAAPPAEAHAPSLAAIVAQEQRPLWRYLRLLGADAHEADDLLQDTFVQFATAARAAGEPRVVAAYLRGIARNLLLAARRRRRREAPDGIWMDAVDALAAADPHAFTDARITALRACLADLQGRARQAIEWHNLDGLSRRDTAERLGLADEGAKSLLTRARDALRQCIERRLRHEEP